MATPRIERGSDRHAARRGCGRAVLVFTALILTGTAFSEERVLITGGVDGTGQNYTWTIRNAYTLPIVYVEIPHYHADTFEVPDGWEKECTNLLGVGTRRFQTGVCQARPKPGVSGIRRGRQDSFRMRIAGIGGARPRSGEVTIGFADGSQVVVAGVQLPSAPSWGEKHAMGIGLALIFVVLIVLQVRRKRVAAASASGNGTGADNGADSAQH